MSPQRKLNTFEPGANYKVLVTAALEYLTGYLHPGHPKTTFFPPHQLHSYLNMRQRYFQQIEEDGRSVESIFVGGPDSHGIHVALTAKDKGLSPEKFIKKVAKENERVLRDAGIDFTHYVPTHIPENKRLAQKAFESMRDGGYLIEKEVDAVYCPVCGYNPPPKSIAPPIKKSKGSSPNGALSPRKFSKENLPNQYHDHCGKDSKGKLEYLEGLNHNHLDLQKLAPRIYEFLSKVEILKTERSQLIKGFREDEPWDFTREKNWGWPIPGTDGEQQFYVWFDALFGYLSALQDYFEKQGTPDRFKEFTQGKNALMIHHTGKDISVHHNILWPAMLTAYNKGVPDDEKVNLPAAIYIRGHLMVYKRDENGKILTGKDEKTGKEILLTEKMSKSEGNAPALDDVVNEHGSDMLSFYLTLTNPLSLEDTVYDENNFSDVKNNLFGKKISNLVSRTLGLIEKRTENKIPEFLEDRLTSDDIDFRDVNASVFREVAEYIESGHHKKALERIVDFAQQSNLYLDTRAPWEKGINDEERNNVLYLATNAVRNISLLLKPYTPNMSEKIRDMLNIDYEWAWPDEGQIDLPSSHKIGKVKHLVELRKEGNNPREGRKKKDNPN